MSGYCLCKSKKIKKIIVAPGNGLMDYKIEKIKIESSVAATDFDGILKTYQKNIKLI
jgi:hypothetical protein